MQRYFSKLAIKHKTSIDSIIEKIETDTLYASAMEGMFRWHSKKTYLQKQVHQKGLDPLTWLPWRSSYDRVLGTIVKKISTANRREADSQSWLCMVDCDNFKTINDTYGHKAWDHALTEVVRIMKETVREEDFIARLWWDEFALIIKWCSEEAMWKIGEKLRQAVEWSVLYTVAWKKVPLWITLSLWISPIRKSQKDSQIWADWALYCAKWIPQSMVASYPKWKNGNRNNVYIYNYRWLVATDVSELL